MLKFNSFFFRRSCVCCSYFWDRETHMRRTTAGKVTQIWYDRPTKKLLNIFSRSYSLSTGWSWCCFLLLSSNDMSCQRQRAAKFRAASSVGTPSLSGRGNTASSCRRGGRFDSIFVWHFVNKESRIIAGGPEAQRTQAIESVSLKLELSIKLKRIQNPVSVLFTAAHCLHS